MAEKDGLTRPSERVAFFMPREGGQMPSFKDTTTPVDVADGGGVTGYAATGSSPYVGNSSQADVFNDYYAGRIASEMGSRDRR